MPEQEREHIPSVNCWCKPVVESYGAQYGSEDIEADEDDDDA